MADKDMRAYFDHLYYSAFAYPPEMYYPDEQKAYLELMSLEDKKERILAEVNHAIARARSRYGELRNRRVPSTSRFPNEILAMVFEYAHAASPKANPPVELTLSQVSRTWRHIVVNISALWTYVEISVKRPTGSVSAYLYRSRDRPISVRLELGRSNPWAAIQCIWSVLACHSHRWQRLSIRADCCPRIALFPLLGKLRYLCVPSLEDMEIKQVDVFDDDNFTDPPLKSIFHCGCYPKLASIRFEGFGLRTYVPPLKGLTTLFLHKLIPESRLPFADLQRLLTSLPILTNLSIYDELIEDVEDLDVSPIHLPILRSLRVRGDYEFASCGHILLCIDAPSLELLEFVDIFYDDIDDFISDTPKDQEKFPSLHTLTFESCHFSKANLRNLSTLFPSVKHLKYIWDFDLVLEVLSETPCWKNVSTASFWTWTNQEMRLFKMRKMLLARIAMDVPIGNLFVPNKPPMFPNLLLRDCVPLQYMKRPASWPVWAGIFENV